MKMSFWKDKEVIKLFTFVEEQKNKNIKMSDIFKSYAQISKRKPNSVRNYYYLEISNYKNNPERLSTLGIDINDHCVKKSKKFDSSEVEDINNNINQLKAQGYSVRSACFKLANGNLEQMVRLQNKYRVESKKNSIKKLQKTNSVIGKSDKIIAFPKKSKSLTDSDITSLFLGLVKLVKKSALEDANQNLIKDAEFANKALQNTLENLSRKEGEIALIRQQFRILKKENQVLKEQLNNCKCQKSQNEKLSNFVEELSNKNTKLAKS